MTAWSTDLQGGLSERRAASRALHERVSAFARDTAPWDASVFNALAWDIALYQRRYIAGLSALWGQAPFTAAMTSRDHWATLPAVPVEALRFRDVFAFAPSEAAQCFRTSGTTSAETGRHWLLTTETYREIVLTAGKPALLPHADGAVVLALLPFNGPETTSSLEFMAQRFMEAWDGRELSASRSAAGFRLTEPGRWLLSASGVDVAALRRSVVLAHQVGEPVLLLATSFALLGLLDQLAGEALPLPPGSVVMPTGGFKGRTREVDPAELRAQTQALLGPHAIVHEYGMTELASQLYERSAPAGEAAAAEPGLYLESRTVRVVPVDPVSLLPVPDGEVGIASFVDLGNVDSAVRILTQDRVVRTGDGIRLLGRSPRAPARGCSLLAEALGSSAVSREETAVALPQVNESAPARDATAALARVGQLLAAAAVLQSASSPQGQALRLALQHQGLLSVPGIELALQHCLETSPSAADVSALVASVVPAPRVWVLLSANVFVGAHRAIALGLAASADVRVRPSRRDPHLLRALSQLAPGLFQTVEEIQPAAGDHVYAYGSDEALSAVRKTLPNGVFFHAHGSGIGAAWAGEGAEVVPVAQALARDLVLFDQRGCLSPRLLALSEPAQLNPWLRALSASLTQWAAEVPLGDFNTEEHAAVTRFRTTAALAADELLDVAGSWIAVQHEPERILLPPAGRHLVVVTGRDALERIAQAEALVTSVGVAGSSTALTLAQQQFPRARVVLMGNMQQPRFDGPVDRRQPRQGVRIGSSV